MMCANCVDDNGFTLFDALENIVWYDGHYIWLKELYYKLKACQGKVPIITMPSDLEWHTEKHAIWMLLVGMFGSWGTSIRSGWIEKPKECADFIEALCKEYWEMEDEL